MSFATQIYLKTNRQSSTLKWTETESVPNPLTRCRSFFSRLLNGSTKRVSSLLLILFLLVITPSTSAASNDPAELQTLLSQYIKAHPKKEGIEAIRKYELTQKIVNLVFDRLDPSSENSVNQYADTLALIESLTDTYPAAVQDLAFALQNRWNIEYGRIFANISLTESAKIKTASQIGFIAPAILVLLSLRKDPSKLPQLFRWFRYAIPLASTVAVHQGTEWMQKKRYLLFKNIPMAPAHQLTLGEKDYKQQVQDRIDYDQLLNLSTGLLSYGLAGELSVAIGRTRFAITLIERLSLPGKWNPLVLGGTLVLGYLIETTIEGSLKSSTLNEAREAVQLAYQNLMLASSQNESTTFTRALHEFTGASKQLAFLLNIERAIVFKNWTETLIEKQAELGETSSEFKDFLKDHLAQLDQDIEAVRKDNDIEISTRYDAYLVRAALKNPSPWVLSQFHGYQKNLARILWTEVQAQSKQLEKDQGRSLTLSERAHFRAQFLNAMDQSDLNYFASQFKNQTWHRDPRIFLTQAATALASLHLPEANFAAEELQSIAFELDYSATSTLLSQPIEGVQL
jgi:hypothetical protein